MMPLHLLRALQTQLSCPAVTLIIQEDFCLPLGNGSGSLTPNSHLLLLITYPYILGFIYLFNFDGSVQFLGKSTKGLLGTCPRAESLY